MNECFQVCTCGRKVMKIVCAAVDRILYNGPIVPMKIKRNEKKKSKMQSMPFSVCHPCHLFVTLLQPYCDLYPSLRNLSDLSKAVKVLKMSLIDNFNSVSGTYVKLNRFLIFLIRKHQFFNR